MDRPEPPCAKGEIIWLKRVELPCHPCCGGGGPHEARAAAGSQPWMHVPDQALSMKPRGMEGPSARASTLAVIQHTPLNPAALLAFATDQGRRGAYPSWNCGGRSPCVACSPTEKSRTNGNSSASAALAVPLKVYDVGVVAPERFDWPEQTSTVPTRTLASAALAPGAVEASMLYTAGPAGTAGSSACQRPFVSPTPLARAPEGCMVTVTKVPSGANPQSAMGASAWKTMSSPKTFASRPSSTAPARAASSATAKTVVGGHIFFVGHRGERWIMGWKGSKPALLRKRG